MIMVTMRVTMVIMDDENDEDEMKTMMDDYQVMILMLMIT